MPKGVRIIDRDKGYKALLRRVRRARGKAVKVGILSGSGNAGGVNTLDVASIHEFGLGPPERSFIRAWVDADEAKLEDDVRRLAESVVNGTNTYEIALEKIGVLMAAKSQKFIQDGRVTPPTIKSGEAGSNTTLIDQANLVNAISHEVE